MFRNIYIQAYKTSIQQNSTLQMMLIHINHIYAGMGCIIQDIQFMIGNMLTHLKNSSSNSNKITIKNDGHSSISDKNDKNQDFPFKAPKYQYLPSSSLKCPALQFPKYMIRQTQKYKQQQPNKKNKKIINDTFQQIFLDKKQNNKNNQFLQSNKIHVIDQYSQDNSEDFMDYLFNKKNKN